MKNGNLLKRIALSILFTLPFFTFFLIFHLFAVNVPFEDDFGILENIYHIGVIDDFNQQFKIFISTSNEHPIIISKIFFGLNIWLFKSINFKALMFLGNLMFLSCFIVFFKLCKQNQLSVWVLLPLPYILLSASSFESGLWAICSFQYNAICGYLLWAIYFIFSNNNTFKRFLWGLFFLVCTLVCNGNGILAFVLVIAGLVYQKRWKETGVAVVVIIIMKLFILSNSYYKVPNPLSITISNLFVLVGGSFKTHSLNNIVRFVGATFVLFITTSVLMYIFKRSKNRFEFILLLIGLFSLGSLLGISLFRDIPSSLFADRYRLYPQLLLICVYLLAIIYYSRYIKYINIFASIFGVIYFLHTFYVTYPSILNIYQKKKLLSANWYTNGSTLNGSFYRLFFDKTMNSYVKENLYKVENSFIDIDKIKESESKFEENISVENIKNGKVVKITNIDCSKISKNAGYYLILKNKQQQCYFLPVLHIQNTMKGFLSNYSPLRNEILVPVNFAEIPVDTYNVGILSNIDFNPTYFMSNHFITSYDVGYQQ